MDDMNGLWDSVLIFVFGTGVSCLYVLLSILCYGGCVRFVCCLLSFFASFSQFKFSFSLSSVALAQALHNLLPAWQPRKTKKKSCSHSTHHHPSPHFVNMSFGWLTAWSIDTVGSSISNVGTGVFVHLLSPFLRLRLLLSPCTCFTCTVFSGQKGTKKDGKIKVWHKRQDVIDMTRWLFIASST